MVDCMRCMNCGNTYLDPGQVCLAELLAQRFGPEWSRLTREQQRLVCKDFADMLLEEYDTPDPTMPDGIAKENAHEASREYRRRIGGGNLAAYVKCLEVHAAGDAERKIQSDNLN